MTEPAAFRACYADWKVVKTRACVQVIFELPLEAADTAYQVLGGMPIAATEIWCAVARIKPGKDGDQSDAPGQPVTQPRPAQRLAGADKERRPFGTLPYSTQAALRCQEPVFRAFLREMCGQHAEFADSAAEAVRNMCEVESRKDIRPGTEAEKKWLEIEQWFDAWKTRERVA